MTPETAVEFLRNTLMEAGTIHETKMFGGIGFMLNGNNGRRHLQAGFAHPGW